MKKKTDRGLIGVAAFVALVLTPANAIRLEHAVGIVTLAVVTLVLRDLGRFVSGGVSGGACT